VNFDSSVLQVAIEDIIPSRFQPRLSFDDASLKDLASSIKQHGIIQPLVLRRMDNKYEIVAGERRYKAAILAGLTSVPAVVAKVDEKTSAEVAIAENVQRRELSAIEEAKSYKALLDLGYMSKEMLASKLGLSTSAIQNKLNLLTLSREVQSAIMENKISERHGRSLLNINNPDKQIKWLNKIINERLNVRTLDELLRQEFGELKNINNAKIYNEGAKEIMNQENNNINIPNVSAPIFNMGGPIELGEKNTNKFFNNLEDQAVNMNMTETINPFLQNNDFISPVVSPIQDNMTPANNINFMTEPVVAVDTVDSLDFEPPKKQEIDLSSAIAQINELVEKLKLQQFNIDSNTVDLNETVTITINPDTGIPSFDVA